MSANGCFKYMFQEFRGCQAKLLASLCGVHSVQCNVPDFVANPSEYIDSIKI